MISYSLTRYQKKYMHQRARYLYISPIAVMKVFWNIELIVNLKAIRSHQHIALHWFIMAPWHVTSCRPVYMHFVQTLSHTIFHEVTCRLLDNVELAKKIRFAKFDKSIILPGLQDVTCPSGNWGGGETGKIVKKLRMKNKLAPPSKINISTDSCK